MPQVLGVHDLAVETDQLGQAVQRVVADVLVCSAKCSFIIFKKVVL